MSTQIYQAFIGDDSPPDLSRLTPEQVRQLLIQRELNKAQPLQTGSIGPNAPVDLQGFYELVQKVVTMQQEREGSTDTVDFSQDYPPTPYERETVTFHLDRREPGTVSKEPPFTTGVRNYKPLHRESFPDPDHPGYNIHTFQLIFDNLIGLTCWANTNKQVNRRAMWLEETMLSWGWFFQYNGIDRLVYYGQGQDSRQENDNVRLMYRSLSFYVRTQRLYTLQEKTIDDVLVSFQLA